MIQGLPSYAVREWGAALEAGYRCPLCTPGRLHANPDNVDRLTCDSCGGVFNAGWRRHVWQATPPATLRGTPVRRLGGFYETIQNYPAPPRLMESVSDELPGHLADFVLDIDRDDLFKATTDAMRLHAFLDALAPGQTRIYFSGSKGFHLVVPWQTLGASPSSTLAHREYRELAALIARRTGVVPDYKIYSPARMLRVPDSWHPKTGMHKVEVLPEEIWEAPLLAYGPRGVLNLTPPTFSPAMYALFQEACERAEAQDAFTASPVLAPDVFGASPPCVSRLLSEGLPAQGTRHAMYLMLARYWLSSGQPLTVMGGFTGNTLVGGALMLGREYASLPDPNTHTPQSVRVRDMEDTIHYVYRNRMRFSCAAPRAAGLCSPSCPIRELEDHPVGGLFMNAGRMTGA